jgi:arylsulfatase A-like enzyme
MSSPAMDRPNILLITTDQQHAALMSCAGDPYVKTPNLDRLADRGVRFERAYSANPVCVPCRYSFLTGRMPHVFNGMEHNYKGSRQDTPMIADCISTPTMGHIFRDAGYNTALGGKTHVEGPYGFSKELEEHLGFTCVSSDIRDGLGDECVRFLNAEQEEPFLLWASFDYPHDICSFLNGGAPDDLPGVPLPPNASPTENEADWIAGFRDGTLGTEREIELGLNRWFGSEAHNWDDETWQLYRAEYRRQMEIGDTQIGRVLDALEDSGYADSTVIVFTCDHGDHDGAHGLTMKRSFYDESARIPFMISSPSGVRGIVNTTHLINNGLDLLPTLCDIAGIRLPESLNGMSLYGVAAGAAPPARDFTVSQTVGGRMIRTPRYKYCIYHFERSEEMLFDMDADPGEMRNLAAAPQMQDTLSAHRAMLADWAEGENDAKAQIYLAAL